MDIWGIGALNRISLRGRYAKVKFQKTKKKQINKTPVLKLAFDRVVFNRNVAFSVIVLSTKKWNSSFLKNI